jgi:hypothetical protein
MTALAPTLDSRASDRSNRVVWLWRLVLIALSVSLPLLILELVLRAVGPVLPGNYLGYLYLEPHPVYGFFHVPGSSGWLKTNEYMAHVEINANGLRERDVEYPKPADVRRVLVIGDSFVEGAQVVTEDLLTRRLESILTQRTSLRYEVINAGVAAWGTDQEYLFLKSEGMRYQPDLVVNLFYTGNDVENNSSKIKRTDGQPRKPYFELSSSGGLRAQPFVPRAPREEDSADKLRRSSLLFGLLDPPSVVGSVDADDESPERQLVLHELPVYSERSNARWEEAWKVTEALQVAMRDEVERAGAPFLLVNAPTKWEVYPDDWAELRKRNALPSAGWDLSGPSRKLNEIAQRNGLKYLDLRPALQSAASGPRLYYRTDIHWTPAGHAAAAEAIADAIVPLK